MLLIIRFEVRMNLDENLNETKTKQADLRVIQQKRDRGYTFGHDYKHPCKKVISKFFFNNHTEIY